MIFWLSYIAVVICGLVKGFADGFQGKPPIVSAAIFALLLVAIIIRASEKGGDMFKGLERA